MKNISLLKDCKINGVAVISSILSHQNITRATQNLKNEIDKILNKKVCLTIAGSDPSGGAGVQADLKTFQSNYIYGESIITAITIQNSLGVSDVFPIAPNIIEKQIDCIFKDIVPNATKIGMVYNEETIKILAKKIDEDKIKNIVIDTVMVSSSGRRLLDENCLKSFETLLIPKATLITPNIPEAEILADMKIKNKDDMEHVAQIIFEKYGVNVLLKGGHGKNSADDLLLTKNHKIWFCNPKVNNPNTHGTGCTLSSAIACNLASGLDLEESVKNAKNYITKILESNLNLGLGNGPLDHGYIKSMLKKAISSNDYIKN